tara:strand:- start:115 stop:798 length:684 start_codon:yes stop_codon:yes gene_type:complete
MKSYNKSKKALELFSGTGSFKKVASKDPFNWHVVGVDNDPDSEHDILVDIANWDFKSDPNLPASFDYIHASPPCISFTLLNAMFKRPHREVKNKTLKPLTKTGRLGDKLLHKTFAIIDFFLKKNPNMKFCIENPRGFMRYMPIITKRPLYRTTTSYSQYGFKYNKPTDFFTNFPLKLRPVDTPSNPSITRKKGLLQYSTGMKVRGQNRKTLYRIPPTLIKRILLSSS